MQKVCKAANCGKTFEGTNASKFCSLACRKKGEAKQGFVSETVLIKSEEINKKEEAKRPVLKLGQNIPGTQPFKKEYLDDIDRLKQVERDTAPKNYLRPMSTEYIVEVKRLMMSSATIGQVVSNIITKHKYKDPKHVVAHIEDMLLLYGGNNEG